jgi:hypothetical protein
MSGRFGEANISELQCCLQRIYFMLPSKCDKVVTILIACGGGGKKKVKLSLYRSWRPLGLREVEAPTFSDIRHTDGGKVVSLTRRPHFIPRKIRGAHFC